MLYNAKQLRVPQVFARLGTDQNGMDTGKVACQNVGKQLITYQHRLFGSHPILCIATHTATGAGFIA